MILVECNLESVVECLAVFWVFVISCDSPESTDPLIAVECPPPNRPPTIGRTRGMLGQQYFSSWFCWMLAQTPCSMDKWTTGATGTGLWGPAALGFGVHRRWALGALSSPFLGTPSLLGALGSWGPSGRRKGEHCKAIHWPTLQR